jgi:hypothetical protein
MKWYVAKLIYKCVIGKDRKESCCEEQIRVILARTPASALRKARRIGKCEEVSYQNVAGEKVRWTLAGLSDLEEMSADEISSGTEICGSIFDNVKSKDLVKSPKKFTVSLMERNGHRRAINIIMDMERRARKK